VSLWYPKTIAHLRLLHGTTLPGAKKRVNGNEPGQKLVHTCVRQPKCGEMLPPLHDAAFRTTQVDIRMLHVAPDVRDQST